eukprot:1013692-Pyramimonas_sp.AAC.1
MSVGVVLQVQDIVKGYGLGTYMVRAPLKKVDMQPWLRLYKSRNRCPVRSLCDRYKSVRTRVYTGSGSQSQARREYILGVGANHSQGESIYWEWEPITGKERVYVASAPSR